MESKHTDASKQRTFDGETVADERIAFNRTVRESLSLGRDSAHEWIDHYVEADDRQYWTDILTAYGEYEDDDEDKPDRDDLESIGEPGAVSFLVEWEDIPLPTAIAYEPLGYCDDIKAGVIEAAKPIEEWHSLDPTKVESTECVHCGDTLFQIEHEEECWHCGWDACFVDADGESRHADYLDDESSEGYYDTLERGLPLCGWCEESFLDYSDTIVGISSAGEKCTLYHDDGIVIDPYWLDGASVDETDVGEYMYEFVSEGTPEGWEWVKSGWHSSMERSDVSETINALTSGEYHEYAGFDFPLIVKFGTTGNVCTIGISVCVPNEHAEFIEGVFDGKHGIGSF